MRIIWTLAGLTLTALGLIGAIVPLMPSVVFLLGAAFCFLRGSGRLHDWLIGHPVLGPPVTDWRERGAISRRSKRLAMIAIALSFAISAALGAAGWLLAAQAAALTLVAIFIMTRPDGSAA